MSQSHRDHILSMLLDGPVCGTTMLREYMPRYAARIGELRNDGYNIKTVTCKVGTHEHRTRQVQYELVLEHNQTEMFV
jgi:hypothetical protein